jgi:hypothetical protein
VYVCDIVCACVMFMCLVICAQCAACAPQTEIYTGVQSQRFKQQDGDFAHYAANPYTHIHTHIHTYTQEAMSRAVSALQTARWRFHSLPNGVRKATGGLGGSLAALLRQRQRLLPLAKSSGDVPKVSQVRVYVCEHV